jgi:hypothetical protein
MELREPTPEDEDLIAYARTMVDANADGDGGVPSD